MLFLVYLGDLRVDFEAHGVFVLWLLAVVIAAGISLVAIIGLLVYWPQLRIRQRLELVGAALLL